MVSVPAQRRAKLTSFPQCLTIPPRYHGGVEPSPIGWILESINMTNWKADLDALVEATTALTKSVRVEPPMPRTDLERLEYAKDKRFHTAGSQSLFSG